MRSPSDINILIVDDDGVTQDALQQMFDAEGWFSRGVPDPREAMAELAHRHWTLVIANIALVDADSPLFAMLKELARADADTEPNAKPLRALFLVPTATARWAHRILDREHLPYAIKPFHLHDFLEKVSDLLVDAQAIPQPARDVKSIALKERKQKRSGHDRRSGKMFASREDYMMTEEEIAEFERQEEEDRKKRQEEAKSRDLL